MNILDTLKIDKSLFDSTFCYPFGSTSPELYIIGSSPDTEDLITGTFSSKSYASFYKVAAELGIKQENCRFYYASPFRPVDNRKFNRSLTLDEVNELSKFVLNDIQKFKPKTILCLGRSAASIFTNEDVSIKSLRHLEKSFNDIPIVFTYSSNYFNSSEGINERDHKSWVSDITRAFRYEEFKSKKDSINNLEYEFIDINEAEKISNIFKENEKIVLDYEASSLRPILNKNFHIGGVGLYGMESKKAVYIYIHDFFRRYKDFTPPKDKLDFIGKFLESKQLIVFNAQYECNATAKYFNVEIRNLEDLMMAGRMMSESGGLKEIASRKLHIPIWTSNIDVWNDALVGFIEKVKKRKKPKKEEYDHTGEIKYVLENNKTIFDIKELLTSKIEDSVFKILKDSLKDYLMKENLDKTIVKDSNISVFKFWSKIHSEELEYFEAFKNSFGTRGFKIESYNNSILPLLKNESVLSKIKENCLSLKDVEIIRAIEKFEKLIADLFTPDKVEEVKIELTKYIIDKIENKDYDINYAEIPVQIVAPYCVNDIIRTGELYEVIMGEIKEKKLEDAFKIYNDQELLGVELENNGIAWDDKKATELASMYEKIILDSGKKMILSDRMKRVLELKDQDVLKIQSATSLETLTEYFNPLSTLPSAGTRARFGTALSSVRFRVIMLMYQIHKEISEVGLNKMDSYFPVLYPLYKMIMATDSPEDRLQLINKIAEYPDLRTKIVNSNTGKDRRQTEYFFKFQNFELESMSSESIDDIFHGFVTIAKMDPDNEDTWLEEFSNVVHFKIYKRAIKFLGTYIKAKLGRFNVYLADKEDVKNNIFKRIGYYQDGDICSENQVYINEGEYGVCSAETRRWRAGCFTGDTEVLLSNGDFISFKELIDNDIKEIEILSFNKEISKYIKTRTSNIFCTGKKEILELEFDDGYKVKCTPDHRFLTRSRGWVEAQNLTEEDELESLTKNQSAAFKRWSDKVYRNNIINVMKKRKHSEKSKEKISESMKGNTNNKKSYRLT